MTDPDARYLTLIRHAKSSWDSDAPSDFERPLNRRGRRDAPRMGAELERLGIRFEHVFCSSAVRARETLAGLRHGLVVPEDRISYHREIYLAPTSRLYDLVAAQPDQSRDIALIGHNPGMEDLAAMLSGGAVVRMPTCCVVRLRFVGAGEGWAQCLVNGGSVELLRLARELA